MSHRRIEKPHPEGSRRAKSSTPGRRESTRRRMDIEGLEARQLMAAQVLTEYPIPLPTSSPSKISLVSDGSLWFTENSSRPGTTPGSEVAKLGRVTTTGTLTEPATLLPDDATYGITVGSDSDIWTTEQGPTPAVAQVSPALNPVTGEADNIVEYTNFAPIAGNPTPTHFLNSITSGPASNPDTLWFTDSGTNTIDELNVNSGPSQVIQEFPLPAGHLVGSPITAGPAGDDGVYFLETASFGTQTYIGRIDPNGVITEFPVTNPDGLAPGTPTSLKAGPDDSIYFTEANTGRIGQLNLATGVVNDAFFTVPSVALEPGQTPTSPGPTAISEFPDGSLFITESNIGSIARLTVNSSGAVSGFFQYSTFPTVSGALTGITSDLSGNPWFTETGNNRIATFTVPTSPLQAQPVTIDGTVNQPLSNITVATFTDPDGPSENTEYTATINWGDGTTTDSDTTISPTGSSTSFQVLASHTYTLAGTYTPVVTITDLASPRTATVFDTAIISPINPVTPGTVIATAGTPFLGISSFGASEPVATFPVNAANPGTYSATVDWGDGTALGGATITGPTLVNGVETDSIVATHTFAKGGTYNGSVTLRNSDGTQTDFALQSLVAGLTFNGGYGPLDGTAGTPLDIQGIPLVALIAAPVLPGSLSPLPDASFYSATIDWGDGSPVGSATVIENAVGDAILVLGDDHTYAAPGTYQISYTVGDSGAPNLFRGTFSAVIGTVTGVPVISPAVVGVPLTGAGGQQAPIEIVNGLPAPVGGYYSATIDYGDGSPTSVGTIITEPDGTLIIDAPSHTYETPGLFPLNILIGTTGQPNLAHFTNTITVTEAPIAIIGALNPTSDSGISNTDGITNDVTPNFYGFASPGSTVRLYSVPTSSPFSTPTFIGQGAADASSGAYSINTSPLADGSYLIEAVATSKFGGQTATVFPETAAHPLVIDTVGPKITAFKVTNTLKGQFQVTYQDELSGLVPADLVDGSNYTVDRTAPKPRVAQNFIVSSLSATPELFPTDPVTVTGSVFNGHYLVLRGGVFVFSIDAAGITDVAGNALDGEFYGTFPTGNGQPGGNFQAQVVIKGYTPSGPTPFSTANPSQPGTAAVSPTVLAPKLPKPGLNAPPTSLPGVSTGQQITATEDSKKVEAKAVKPKTIVAKAKPKVTVKSQKA